jgi:protein ImuB
MPLHEAVELLRVLGEVSGAGARKPVVGGGVVGGGVKGMEGRVERHDPQGDAVALGRLADELLIEISPLVAIEPLPTRGTWAGVSRRGPEVLLVDIRGIGDWFGGEGALIDAVRRWLGRLGGAARMAIADTSGAAWGMARYGELAVEVLPEGKGDAWLDRLPVRALRIAHDTAHQLDRLGVETIGQLRALPRGGLATRLGADLILRIDQMFGAVTEALAMHHTEPEDEAGCELEYPTNDQGILGHRIGLLIDAVCERLAGRVRGALRLVCRLGLVDRGDGVSDGVGGGESVRLEVGLFAPTADAAHLRRLMLTALENRTLTGLVGRVDVSVELGGPLRLYQTDLFDDARHASGAAGRQAYARMIETVAMRLGGDGVLGVELTDHSRPEWGYRLRPLAGVKGVSGGAGVVVSGKGLRRSGLPLPLGPAPSDPLRRPLGLLVKPRPIRVEVSSTDGALTRVGLAELDNASAARTWEVRHCWGPERIETRGAVDGWERRDYYRIELEDGQWWWVFCQGLPGMPQRWRLHGRFG